LMSSGSFSEVVDTARHSKRGVTMVTPAGLAKQFGFFEQQLVTPPVTATHVSGLFCYLCSRPLTPAYCKMYR
jgi:hypothetical protein